LLQPDAGALAMRLFEGLESVAPEAVPAA